MNVAHHVTLHDATLTDLERLELQAVESDRDVRDGRGDLPRLLRPNRASAPVLPRAADGRVAARRRPAAGNLLPVPARARRWDSESHRRAYIYRIATNLVRDSQRRSKQAPVADLDVADLEASPSTADPSSAADTRTDLRRAMARLRPRDRAMLWLAYRAGAGPHRDRTGDRRQACEYQAAAVQSATPSRRVASSRGRETMTRFECPHEQETLDALSARRLPGRAAPELLSHLEACEVCRDLAMVVAAMQEACDEDAPSPTLSAATVWWRAQLRAHREASRKAAVPIRVAQVAAVIVALVTIAALQPLVPSWRPTLTSILRRSPHGCQSCRRFDQLAVDRGVAAAVARNDPAHLRAGGGWHWRSARGPSSRRWRSTSRAPTTERPPESAACRAWRACARRRGSRTHR